MHSIIMQINRIIRIFLWPVCILTSMFYGSRLKNLIMRRGTTDQYTFLKIFLLREYNVHLDFKPEFIIDAGANVGYSSIFFNMIYPKASIVAIEPEESNYNILKKNTNHIKNIHAIKAGLWSKRGYLNIIGEDLPEKKDSFITILAKKGIKSGVPATTIKEILKKYNKNSIDILKMDIEGAEKEVFSRNYLSWIDKVKVIMIELHEHLNLGSKEALEKAIQGRGFKKFNKGENLILIKQKRIKNISDNINKQQTAF